MKKEDLKGEKIGVLGLGVEGFVSAAYLHKLGAVVTVLEQKNEEDISQETRTNLKNLGVQFRFGKRYKDDLQSFDIIVRSPGVKLSQTERDELKKHNTIVTSQTQLFLELCPARVIGVTGTKGKGTTSSLIYEMLKASDLDAYLGGNIGTPPFTFLDSLTKSSVVVLELSSFQLEDVTISPHIAVLLMIVPDHLQYHGDMTEYVEAKRNIIRYQTPEDFAVINRDYLPSNESDIYTEGKVFQVTRERSTTEQGSFIKDNAIWLRVQNTEWKIVDLDAIALIGKHNAENVAAAAMAATLAGASKEEIVTVSKTFTGLTHRLQKIGEVQGVRYFDDSIATNPESAIAAIEAFSDPKILILGGVTEGSDFTELGKVIAQDRTIKAIIGIGTEWPAIKTAIEKQKPFEHMLFIEGAKDMEQIVQAASKLARSGDVVLLSPACKSFDMFKSYQDRGDQFIDAVKSLQN